MWWLITACAPVPDRPDLDPAGGDGETVDAAPIVPIDELLQQAAEKGVVGDAGAAIAAWRLAHAGWQTTREAQVRLACDRCATEIEYDFGRLRAEISQRGGHPLPVLVEIRAGLARWDVAPPPPTRPAE